MRDRLELVLAEIAGRGLAEYWFLQIYPSSANETVSLYTQPRSTKMVNI